MEQGRGEMDQAPDEAWEIAAIKGSKPRILRKMSDFSRGWDRVLVSDAPQSRAVDWARVVAGEWDAIVRF
jgi:hypothetical protein